MFFHLSTLFFPKSGNGLGCVGYGQLFELFAKDHVLLSSGIVVIVLGAGQRSAIDVELLPRAWHSEK